MPSTHRLIVLAFSIFNLIWSLLLGIPVHRQCLAQIKSNREKPYLKKRNVVLMYGTVWICSVFVCILVPLQILGLAWHIYPWPFMVSFILGNEYFLLFCLFQSCKMYLQFVNIRISQELYDWKKVINENYTSVFTKYQKWFTNVYLIIFASLVVFLLMSSVALCLIFVSLWMSSVAFLAFGLLVVFAFWILGAFVFHVADFWYIREELFLSSVAATFGGAVIFASQMTTISHESFSQSRESFRTSTMPLITVTAMNVGYLLWCVASTWYVIHRNESKIARLEKHKSENVNSSTFDEMVHAFQDEKGYVELMKHLQLEFCLENAYFMIELVHFQQYLLRAHLITTENQLCNLKILKSIPVSPIIKRQKKLLKGHARSHTHTAHFGIRWSPKARYPRPIHRNLALQIAAAAAPRLSSLMSPSSKTHSTRVEYAVETPDSAVADIVLPPTSPDIRSNHSVVVTIGEKSRKDKKTKKEKTFLSRASTVDPPPSMSSHGSGGADVPVSYDGVVVIYKYLYEKYLQRISAPFEVNISSHLSQKFLTYFRKLSNAEANQNVTSPRPETSVEMACPMDVNLFEDVMHDLRKCSKEVLELLYDSYLRLDHAQFLLSQ